LLDLPIFPVFCILAGIDDLRHNWPTRNIARAIIINSACYWLLVVSRLPTEAVDLHHWIWRADNWLWRKMNLILEVETPGHDGFQEQIARYTIVQTLHAANLSHDIAWWAMAISVWKAFGWLARKGHAPRWLMPLAACTIHFASAWGYYPLLRNKSWRQDGDAPDAPYWWMPTVKSPGALTEYWIYYTAAPMLLPTRFPLELPRVPLLGRHVQPRLFWPLLSALLYMNGRFVISAATTSSWWDLLDKMPWASLLRFYHTSYRGRSPIMGVTTLSYVSFFPNGLKQFSAPHFVMLDICGMVREICVCVRACMRVCA